VSIDLNLDFNQPMKMKNKPKYYMQL